MNAIDESAACRHPGYETPRMMVAARPVGLLLAADPLPRAAPSAVGARDSYADLREEFAADRSDPRIERECA